jgi:hypothetical protein
MKKSRGFAPEDASAARGIDHGKKAQLLDPQPALKSAGFTFAYVEPKAGRACEHCASFHRCAEPAFPRYARTGQLADSNIEIKRLRNCHGVSYD